MVNEDTTKRSQKEMRGKSDSEGQSGNVKRQQRNDGEKKNIQRRTVEIQC